MKVKIKKLHTDAVIPTYAKVGDAGLDLVAISVNVGETQVTYGTGIAVEIPDGYVGLIFPRSSIYKMGLLLSNSVGIIDSGYRGEIKFKFNRTDKYVGIYQIGDHIGQLIIMPYPTIEFEEVDELSDTERGAGGFGSTGN